MIEAFAIPIPIIDRNKWSYYFAFSLNCIIFEKSFGTEDVFISKMHGFDFPELRVFFI